MVNKFFFYVQISMNAQRINTSALNYATTATEVTSALVSLALSYPQMALLAMVMEIVIELTERVVSM